MTSNKLGVIAARVGVIIALIYLYLPDVQAIVPAGFNKPETFGTFLAIETLHGVLMCFLVWLINRSSFELRDPIRLAAWLMFTNGALFNFAYAMGPPPRGAAVLAEHFREHFRFSFLVAAATVATAGLLVFLLRKPAGKRSLACMATAFMILGGYAMFLYVEVSYYVVRPKFISDLLARGLPLDNDIGQANVLAEAIGRLCFYWGLPLVLFIGVKKQNVSRSAALVIGLLSALAGCGILRAALHGPAASLMPFTIPAWVLMPTYWFGTYLLTTRSKTPAVDFSCQVSKIVVGIEKHR